MDNQTSFSNLSLVLQYSLIAPEYLNFPFLSMSIYGMYQGIEIQHPLYAVLFLNLIVSLGTTIIHLIGFSVLPIEKFIILSNLLNSQSLYFYCTSWCVTSVIRYVYIFHEDWLHSAIPGTRIKCFLAVMTSITYSAAQSSPVFIVVIHYGEQIIKKF